MRFSLFFLFLLVITSNFQLSDGDGMIKDKQICRWRFNKNPTVAFLCMAVRTMIDVAPAGPFFLFVLDYVFGTKATAWDIVRKDVEKYVNSKFDQYTIKTLNVWQRSMAARVQSCKYKTDQTFKISCYRNLQEDLAGYEPLFKGDTAKEKAMALKFYDLYVTTYMSVSVLLKNISEPALQASIDRDVIRKARLFSSHMESTAKLAQAYVCRQFKVKLEKSFVFWRDEKLLWPSDQDIYRYTDPSLDEDDIREELRNDTDKCRIFNAPNTYIATLVNLNNGTTLPNMDIRQRFCKTSRAISEIIPKTYIPWRNEMWKCKNSTDQDWIREIQEKADLLKDVANQKLN